VAPPEHADGGEAGDVMGPAQLHLLWIAVGWSVGLGLCGGLEDDRPSGIPCYTPTHPLLAFYLLPLTLKPNQPKATPQTQRALPPHNKPPAPPPNPPHRLPPSIHYPRTCVQSTFANLMRPSLPSGYLVWTAAVAASHVGSRR